MDVLQDWGQELHGEFGRHGYGSEREKTFSFAFDPQVPGWFSCKLVDDRNRGRENTQCAAHQISKQKDLVSHLSPNAVHPFQDCGSRLAPRILV